MDYSLLVGIHDCAQAEEEAILNENLNRDAAAGRETSESEECESGERYERFVLIINTYKYLFINSKLNRCAYNTPPDSPRCLGQYNDIVQEIDIYALHSIEG